jgi:hypothetical protein
MIQWRFSFCCFARNRVQSASLVSGSGLF